MEKIETAVVYKQTEMEDFCDLVPGKRVLDLGCGPGDHSIYFLNRGLNVKAVDISPEMVALAGQKGVDAEIMDIEKLDFDKDSFDGIWADAPILHIHKKKLPEVLEKLHIILNKKGILYISVKEGRGERYIMEGKKKKFLAFWETGELAGLFLKHFKLVKSYKTRVRENTYLRFFFQNN